MVTCCKYHPENRGSLQRKSKSAGNKEKEVEEEGKIEGVDKEGVKRNWTEKEWRSYGDSIGYEVQVESDYGPWT